MRLQRKSHNHGLSVLEQLQAAAPSAEIWWDSPPGDFPVWRDRLLAGAPDDRTRESWAAQAARLMNLERPQDALVRGVTTNPSLIAKSVLRAPDAWGAEIRRQTMHQASPSVESVFWQVYRETVRRSCQAMLPLWRASGGRYGWVSGQLDPRLLFRPDRMFEQAVRLAKVAPNLMVKVPGSREGYQLVEELVAAGISINSTLSFTVPQFTECIRAVEAGLARARASGVDTVRWRAVMTHMIGRFGSNGDLLEEAAARGIELSPREVRWAELAILKRIDRIITEGGHPVKMLLSSLEVDDPDGGALSMHLEHSAGGDFAYTCKPEFVAELFHRRDECTGFDPGAAAGEPPPEVLAKLGKLPYFRRALDPDGLRPDEFASHSAFLTAYAEVSRNNRKLLDFVAHQLERTAAARPAERVPAIA